MPSGLIKLNFKGDEERRFYENPSINYYKKVYKSYINFVRYEYVDEFFNKSDGEKTFPNNDISISLINAHFIGNMYLYMELINYEENFKLSDLFEKIELKCDNFIINTLTPELINIYSNMYFDSSQYKLFNNCYGKNHRNRYFVPLIFPSLFKNYLPLFLLYNENIYVKFFFKQNYSIKRLCLISEAILIDEIKYFNKKNFMWFTENVSYSENIELTTSIDKDINKVIRLKNYFNKLTKCFIITLEGGILDKLKFQIEDFIYNYNINELRYINILQTNSNYNSFNTDTKSLYLIPFSLFKGKISGFINMNQINNCSIEIKPTKINNKIKFFKVSQFNQQITNFYLETSVKILGTNTPIIYLYYNVEYYLENTNTNIDIVTDKVTKSRYEGYDFVNKKLVVSDDSITELYYCDLSAPLLESGTIEISNKNLRETGNAFLNIYGINYDLYNINDGYLLPFNIES